MAVPAELSGILKNLLNNALEIVKVEGKDKAISAINTPKVFAKPFLTDTKTTILCYIVACDYQANILAHPLSPKLVGKNYSSLKDAKGVLFFKNFIDTAKRIKPGEVGSVDYYWQMPSKAEPVLHTAYVMNVPNNNWFLISEYTMDANTVAI